MSQFLITRALVYITAATHAAFLHDWARDVMFIASLLKQIAAWIS